MNPPQGLEILFNNGGFFQVNPKQEINKKLDTKINISPDESRMFFTYLLREETACLTADHLFGELNCNLDLSKIFFKSILNKQNRFRLLIIESSFIDNVFNFMLSNCFTFLDKEEECINYTNYNSISKIFIPAAISHNSNNIVIDLYFSSNPNFLCSKTNAIVKDQKIRPESLESYINHSVNLIEKLLESKTTTKKNIKTILIEFSKLAKETEEITSDRNDLKNKLEETKKKLEQVEETNKKLRGFVLITAKKQKIEQ